ncbi:MAG: hypothetical protein ACOC5T_02550 [Elusimicrobiota bacterium]
MIKWKFHKDDVNVEKYMDVLKYKESITPEGNDSGLIHYISVHSKTMIESHIEELDSDECFNRGLLSNTRKLNAIFSLEDASDMLPMFGMDFEEEIKKSLSEEISRELDEELKRIMNNDL